MAPPLHPSTPPGDTHSTPTLPSPLSPPLPKTPHVSLTAAQATSQQQRIELLKPIAELGDDADEDMSSENITKIHKAADPMRMSISPPPKSASPSAAQAEEPEQTEDTEAFPSEADLERMKAAAESSDNEDVSEQQAELAKMLKSLLNDYNTRIPFLQQQIEAQQETIVALNQQSRLSKAMYEIERDRFAGERASWRAETRALIRTREAEAAAGNRPKRILDLDVGYHQELEAANKRLEMDNRLMAPRLVDTQKQIESLVNELRILRTHVILDSSQFEADGMASPSASSRPPKPSRSTMGDARAEHLLLAAKKVRSLRKDDKTVGRLTLDELQRRGVVGPGGGIGYSEGYGGDDGEDEIGASDEEESKPIASPMPKRRGSSKATGTPLLPRQKKAKRPAPSTPSRSRGQGLAPQTTPGGGNFSDLLLAAELATRPGTPSRSSASTSRATASSAQYTLESPSKKRRKTPATVEWSTRRHLNQDGDGSPTKSAPTTGGTDDSHEASALDLLAQASQDVAQGSQGSSSGSMLASAARLGGAIDDERSRYAPGSSRSETPLGPAIDLDATPSRPSHEQPSSTPGAFSSPSGGGAVPGIGKYVHLSSTVPARRVRSPYLKWTKEEDELLTRAVMEHGEKWDLVSKCVPTRSYHQVRQRWLRKTGAFDKKPAVQPDPSPLRRNGGDQGSPTPKSRKRHEM